MPLSNNPSAQEESYEAFSLLPVAVGIAAAIRDTVVDCGIIMKDIEDVHLCTKIEAGLMLLTLMSPTTCIYHFSYDILRSTHIERGRRS